jgi:DMSO/TMAO reductase YedYZ heme-binding membrane subunit
MYPIWAGILIDLAFIAVIALIFVFYHFIWYDLLQRNEPFTKEFARIATKRPWFFFGIMAVLIGLTIFAGVQSPQWYWQVIHFTIAVVLGGVAGHVIDYMYDPNNPPHLVRLLLRR